MPTIAEKRRTFRTLHQQGCFVIPNPWDIGTARYLQHLGYKALASTSAGFAFAEGYADNAITRDNSAVWRPPQRESTDMPAEPLTVSQENRPPAIGGALACEASFGSNNRHEGIVLNCAAMANRMSRFWMASRGTTLSRGAFSHDAVGQNRNPSLGGAPAPAVQVKREI